MLKSLLFAYHFFFYLKHLFFQLTTKQLYKCTLFWGNHATLEIKRNSLLKLPILLHSLVKHETCKIRDFMKSINSLYIKNILKSNYSHTVKF